MSLLTPLFLVGLAAIAIPVIIHLTQRSKSTITVFPSVMFLARVPFRTSKRRRIRHPLLFALRCLAFALLVLAFARPFFRGGEGTGLGAGSERELVVLLDRSYSMAYLDRWDRALDAVRDAVADLVPGDHASLVLFAERAEAVLTSTADFRAVERELDGRSPGDGITRYEPALRLASRILSGSELPRREVLVVTDFQRSGWPDGTDMGLPAGTEIRPVDLSDPEPANRAVTDVTVRRNRRVGRERVTITARVSNLATAGAEGVDVSLEIGGKTVATRSIDLEPSASTSVVFPEVAVPDVETRGVVRLAEDGLAPDDALRFIVSADQVIRATLLQGSRAGGDRGVFLSRALGIGDRPPIEVAAVRLPDLSVANLSGHSILILDDTDLSDAGAARTVADWVEAGGGLVVVLGDRVRPSAWDPAAASLLPGRPGDVVDRSTDGGATLANLEYEHPIFEIFRTPRSGDFSRARFFRYREFLAASTAHVLARFDDGRAALIEGPVGEGRVLVWTSTLDRFWTDLPLQPVYLPFVQRLARYAAGFEEEDRWFLVGQLVDVRRLIDRTAARRGSVPPEEWVVVAPSGDRRSLRLDPGAAEPLLLDVQEAGFHELRPLDEAAPPIAMAVNPRLEESDLTALDPEDLVAAVAPLPQTGEMDGGTTRETAEPARTELWWLLMFAAGLVLTAETALSNRLSRRRIRRNRTA